MSLIGSILSSFSGGSSADKGDDTVVKEEDAKRDHNEEGNDEKEWDEEEEYRVVVDKYKALIDTPREEDGCVVKELFKKSIEDLYDKSYMRYIHGEKECNYDECYQETLKLCNYPNLHFKIFRYKKSDEEPRCIDFYLRFSTDDEEFVIRGQYWYKNAKLVRAVQERTVTEKVSGQVSATGEHQLTESRTTRDFGCNVHELPNLVHNRVLGKDAGMVPVEQKYEMLKIYIELKQDQSAHYKPVENLFNPLLFWRKEVVFELYTSINNNKKAGDGDDMQPEKKLYAGGAYFRFVKRAFGVRHVTLYDKDDAPVVFAEKKDQVLTIYGTKALKQDHSAPRMEDLGWKSDRSVDVVGLYPWFRIKRMKTMEGGLFYVVGVLAPGEDVDHKQLEFEPIYKLEIEEKKKNQKQRMASVRDYYNSNDHVGVTKNDQQWNDEGIRRCEVSVAPGIDPALILNVALFLEDSEA